MEEAKTIRAASPRDIKAFVRPHMLKIYPELEDIEIEYGWGGAVGITLNRMPDFGRIGECIVVRPGLFWSWRADGNHGGPSAGRGD